MKKFYEVVIFGMLISGAACSGLCAMEYDGKDFACDVLVEWIDSWGNRTCKQIKKKYRFHKKKRHTTKKQTNSQSTPKANVQFDEKTAELLSGMEESLLKVMAGPEQNILLMKKYLIPNLNKLLSDSNFSSARTSLKNCKESMIEYTGGNDGYSLPEDTLHLYEFLRRLN